MNVSAVGRLLTLALLWLAFGLRCAGLDTQELRGDEAFGYFFSLAPLGEIVEQTLDLGEPHPVASYWLQHLWLRLAGHSEFALRFGGVWWSVLAVALLLPLARQLALPERVGITAAALMALSPYAVWHAQDARMYSMSLALTVASTLFAVRWWRAEAAAGQIATTLGYLLVTWLALHTHYFALYVIVAQNLVLTGWAVAARAWRKLLLWYGIGMLLLLVWLPWLIAARQILLDYQGNGDSPGLLDALVRAHSAFGVGESVPRAWQPAWATLVLAATLLGAVALWRTQRREARRSLWLLIFYWLVPLAATWLSAQSRPIFNERYLVAAVPPVYLLMAAALEMRHRNTWLLPWLGRALFMLALAGMIVGYVRQSGSEAYSKSRGWRGLAMALEKLAAGVAPEKVRLVQNYPDPTLWYYYVGDVPHLVLPPAPHDAQRAQDEVARLVEEGVERVVLVEQPAQSWDAGDTARTALATQFEEAGTLAVERWPLSIWLRPTQELEPLHVAYEGGLALEGALIHPTNAPPGGAVAVHLRWQGEAESVGEQEAVSVQLLDGAGQLVAQSDRPLEMASDTTAHVAPYVILLPMTLVPGDYQASVVVYDPSRAGARRLTVQGADRVPIGKVTVVALE